MYVSGQFVLSDAIPFLPLRWVDFGGHVKAMRRISEELDVVTGRWVDEHLEKGGKSDDERDFIDVMLSEIDDRLLNYGHAKETIIKTTIQIYLCPNYQSFPKKYLFSMNNYKKQKHQNGSDTTSIHLTWILSLLLNHPSVMQRARHEIDTKIGKNRWVQESDIHNLPYLQAVIKESLRLYPPGPISAGPEEFLPERFLAGHAGVDFNGQFYEFIPFGSGRRSCPGAMQVAHLVLARFIQGFEIKTGLDEPVDMSEGTGITLSKATPLEMVITPRLSNELYYS
ncbi:cytochrome P450 [Striga asiatica]|uniref:Cytochrome P450 n=1 Tax=Striga asiatica TaxID=4170 RepID=A0A5A7QZT4_STRAF|nr:cytochrome P450 [Striga asiatica]